MGQVVTHRLTFVFHSTTFVEFAGLQPKPEPNSKFQTCHTENRDVQRQPLACSPQARAHLRIPYVLLLKSYADRRQAIKYSEKAQVRIG
jgi:hypothetical protein